MEKESMVCCKLLFAFIRFLIYLFFISVTTIVPSSNNKNSDMSNDDVRITSNSSGLKFL